MPHWSPKNLVQNQDISATQPSKAAEFTQPSQPKSSGKPPTKRKKRIRWQWVVLYSLILISTITIGAAAGYSSANQKLQKQISYQAQESLQKQFELGVQDLDAGRFDVALQRFEYILSQDPTYPGLNEKLALAQQILHSTATPTSLPATVTSTPTRDPRPITELFNEGVTFIYNRDWSSGIETLISLRKEDNTFQAAAVDGLLYVALRYRGVEKILRESNLEGGIYDLALAERFGPIDVDANIAREWARLYITGLSFWEVHPEQAVYYFSQVAAAAPYLSDSSGWTATDRYRAALIQYADLLSQQEDWCAAQTQYELALRIRVDESTKSVYDHALEMCLGPSPTPSAESGTPTQNITITPAAGTPSATATSGLPATATPTPTTGAPVNTETPSPTIFQSETPAPSVTPEFTNTPIPIETNQSDPPLKTTPPSEEITSISDASSEETVDTLTNQVLARVWLVFSQFKIN